MPVAGQKKLASLGSFIEQCYSMYSIDNISIKQIAGQIREIGANYCILSSDVGQPFSKSPSEALLDFATLLFAEGITEKELRTMLITNPKKIMERR